MAASTQKEIPCGSRTPLPTLPFVPPLRSSSPTLPFAPAPKFSPFKPSSPSTEKSDSLIYSWTSEEDETHTVAQSADEVTNPFSIPSDEESDSDGDILITQKCTRAITTPILGSKKRAMHKLKSTPKPKIIPSSSRPSRIPNTRKRTSEVRVVADESKKKAKSFRGKKKIGQDEEPMDIQDDMEQEEFAPPLTKKEKVNKNYEKFLAMGGMDYYSSKTVLKGRVFDPEVMDNFFVQKLFDRLGFQVWGHLFRLVNPVVYKNEVVEFYVNLNILEEGVVSSKVRGVEIVFDSLRLGEILQVPAEGLEVYEWDTDEDYILTRKFTRGRVKKVPKKVLKEEMEPFHKLLFEIVSKEVLPRDSKRHEASFRDMGIMNALDLDEKINLPALMIKHMQRVISLKKGPHGLAYGYLLTIVFESFGVELKNGRMATKSDMITVKTLDECDCLLTRPTRVKASSLITQLTLELEAAHEENAKQGEVISSLKDQLAASQEQVNTLKDDMIQQNNTHLSNLNALMQLLPKTQPLPPSP